jgi:plastocyanin
MRSLLLALVLAGAQDAENVVTGVVKVPLPAPKAKPERDMSGDEKCACLHEKLPIKEDLLVAADGGVKWAFVYVKKGLEGKKFSVPEKPVLLDQQGCVYHPRVFGVMVGQTLNVRNSDNMLHNVHLLPFNNREENIAQPVKGQVNAVKFTASEVMVNIKCDVHGWMRTYAGVLEHPFYAVTDATGKFTIQGLPPGKYTLGVWQERCKPAELEIEVKAGETKVPDVTLDLRKE